MANRMEETVSKKSENRQRKKVVATSASPEVVSRESFARRLEGMMNNSTSSSSTSSLSSTSSSSPCSSTVACVNCHKERGHCQSGNNHNNHGNNSKRKSAVRHKGKTNSSNISGGSTNNNNNSRNRKKPQHQHQTNTVSAPIVVHLKDSFRFRHSSKYNHSFRQSSLDADSDGSSSRSTDEDPWTTTNAATIGRSTRQHRREDESFKGVTTSVSGDLASGPEIVSRLQSHYHHQNHHRMRSSRYRKSPRGNNNGRLFSVPKSHHYYGGLYHQQTSFHYTTAANDTSSSRKHWTAIISEIEKAHMKDRTKGIDINLTGYASIVTKHSNLINNSNDNNNIYHNQRDEGFGKDYEWLNNSCSNKILLKDVDIKRRNVAESENVDLICNDLYTSNEKLSEESMDESDTSDKSSTLSSSDVLSDDSGGSGTPSGTVNSSNNNNNNHNNNRRNGREFSAEQLEDLVEYTTGAPLLHFDCHPTQCMTCMSAVSSYPYYYSYYDAYENDQASRFLFDLHAHHQMYHHNLHHQQLLLQQQQQRLYHSRHHHNQYHHHRTSHHLYHHYNYHHQQHLHNHRQYRYLHPMQLHNHWIIEHPRVCHDKLTGTNTQYPFDIEEDHVNVQTIVSSSSSSLSSSPPTSPLSTSPPAMITTSSNTVVTICANAVKNLNEMPSSPPPPSSSPSLSSSSSSESAVTKVDDNQNCSQSDEDSSGTHSDEDPTTFSSTTTNNSNELKEKAGNRNNKSMFVDTSSDGAEVTESDSHKDCHLANSVYMDLTGLDVSFSVHYPGDSDYFSWFGSSGSKSNNNRSSNLNTSSTNFTRSLRTTTSASYHQRRCVDSKKSSPSISSYLSISKPSHRLSNNNKCCAPSEWPLFSLSTANSNERESHSYELAMPSNRPWINAGSPDKDVPAAVFTVMCYNVLSDKLCTKAMYGYCPTWALSWDYRKKGIMSDIISGNADIITLQEVETEQYHGLFFPELQKRGYDGVFLPKSRVRTMNSDKEKRSVDGCAIFYKKTKFEKVNEHHVEFSQLATKDGASNTDSDMINRVSTKDNIAIVAMLRTKPAAYEGSPVPAPKGLSQLLMVSTAHIHWDPQLPDVKLVQTIMLVEELRKFIKEVSVQFRPNAPPPSVDSDMCSSLPLILCGDFNSLPDSGVFEFLSKGRLDTRHRDFDGQNYKAFMKDRNENGILNHSFNLTSAYKDVIPFTNYTFDFKGVIDYIFYSSQHIRLHGVMGLQDEEWFRVNKIVGCPHPFVPSDHFPLFAEFSLPAKSAASKSAQR